MDEYAPEFDALTYNGQRRHATAPSGGWTWCGRTIDQTWTERHRNLLPDLRKCGNCVRVLEAMKHPIR